MRAYIHTNIHTYIHTRTHSYTHTRIHAYIHTCMYEYRYVPIYFISNLGYLNLCPIWTPRTEGNFKTIHNPTSFSFRVHYIITPISALRHLKWSVPFKICNKQFHAVSYNKVITSMVFSDVPRMIKTWKQTEKRQQHFALCTN